MKPDQIDPRFRQMGRHARQRRRRVAALRTGSLLAGLAIAVVLVGRVWQPDLSRLADLWPGGDLDQQLVQVESQFDIAPVVRRDTFADIRGDPLIIPAPEGDEAGEIAAEVLPADLMAEPRLIGLGSMVTVMDSPLMPRDRRLVPSLPSTREEFALFRAERGQGRLSQSAQADQVGVPADQRATSSVSFLRDTPQRVGLWRELILETTRATPLSDLLVQNGFDATAAELLSDRIADRLSLPDELPPGAVLALRYRSRDGRREVIQLSVYDMQGYVGSLALSAAGQLVPAADAWADQPLLDELMARREGAPDGAGAQQRLLDLIYAAALRNSLSSDVVGEAIAMMAQVHDLDSLADPDDRLTLILAGEGELIRPGGILFIGISGPGGERRCYVVAAAQGQTECYVPSSRVQIRSAGATLSPPVAGVLTQRFVPPAPGADADDPGRGRVVWSAPEGTPVTAAGDGRITRIAASGAAPAGIEITHEGGFATRYDGVGPVAVQVAQSGQVTRGTVIGTVSRAAGQAEPGLGFQLLSDGVPVDPIPYLSGAGEVLASDAVESLIGRIITVESAGNARARNPLSSATGLGQFIESTWLRMMASYRPDLAQSLDRAALLDLRFDPDLSRQMVRHLAQENEAFLRSRNHAITPGRLYLAHFLGPAGADMALRADPQASVQQVMGAAVVGANPFLRGYTIGDLQHWADRKMTGRATAAVPAPVEVPARIRAYVAAIDRLRQDRDG
ncbi:peptidoglycan DD-metalloendopeptidase family protein [Paracoccus sp. Ld10]|uniref:peptidoglycan DD-metalloendopeptidase family protein n=1 Tax=Paracoccus sp. Ld10 TaxID=649158 RepID=UPI003867108A